MPTNFSFAATPAGGPHGKGAAGNNPPPPVPSPPPPPPHHPTRGVFVAKRSVAGWPVYFVLPPPVPPPSGFPPSRAPPAGSIPPPASTAHALVLGLQPGSRIEHLLRIRCGTLS